MGWKYEQSTGKMYKDGKLIETGYSGALTNKNNPDRQHVKGWVHSLAGHIKSRGILIQKARSLLFLNKRRVKISGVRNSEYMANASTVRQDSPLRAALLCRSQRVEIFCVTGEV